MEDLVAKYGWQKVGAVLVGVSILLMLFVVVSFADIDKKANDDQKKKAEQNQASQTTVRKINPFSQSGEGLKTYTGEHFAITYPETFQIEDYTPRSGVLSSVKLKDVQSNAIVEIAAFNPSVMNISQIGLSYENSGLTKRVYTHELGEATEYNGNVKGSELWQRIVFLQKGNTIIRFLGSYQGKSNSQLLDGLFSDIALSIR